VRQITVAEFIDGYEKGLISDIVVVKDKIYGKSVKGMATSDASFETVWALIP